MLLNNIALQVMLYQKPVDMRKSIDGLSQVVIDYLSSDPGDGTVYIFINRGRDKIKLLYWERNGFCIWYKRLEKQKFIIPQIRGEVLVLTPEQFNWLIDGLDVSKLTGFKRLKYKCFS